MIDLKFLRENPELVKENIKKKFQDHKLPLVDEVIELDKKAREAKQEADDLRSKKNQISKQIGALMAQGKKEEAEAVKAEVAEISKRLTELEPLEKEYQDKVNKMNHNLSCNNLFEDEEKKFLEIIIPKERIKVYEKKYENINSQKEEIEKIYKSMNDKQRQKIQKKKEHCEYQEMKIKESNCVNIQLNKELSDLNAKINKIKKKLKNLILKLKKVIYVSF